jgi:hypothetical protein
MSGRRRDCSSVDSNSDTPLQPQRGCMLPAFPGLRGTELIPKYVMQNSRNQYVCGFA